MGRVAFTSDVWSPSRQNLESYMAITAHFLKRAPATGALSLETRLIAFRILHGSHSGANLGAEFLQVLQDMDCAHKESIGYIGHSTDSGLILFS